MQASVRLQPMPAEDVRRNRLGMSQKARIRWNPAVFFSKINHFHRFFFGSWQSLATSFLKCQASASARCPYSRALCRFLISGAPSWIARAFRKRIRVLWKGSKSKVLLKMILHVGVSKCFNVTFDQHIFHFWHLYTCHVATIYRHFDVERNEKNLEFLSLLIERCSRACSVCR